MSEDYDPAQQDHESELWFSRYEKATREEKMAMLCANDKKMVLADLQELTLTLDDILELFAIRDRCIKRVEE